MKNLGPISRQWLAEAGINTLDELRAKGPVAAYLAIEARGIRPSRVLLYALAGAIDDCHWQSITQERRRSLLLELDAAHDVLSEDEEDQPL